MICLHQLPISHAMLLQRPGGNTIRDECTAFRCIHTVITRSTLASGTHKILNSRRYASNQIWRKQHSECLNLLRSYQILMSTIMRDSCAVCRQVIGLRETGSLALIPCKLIEELHISVFHTVSLIAELSPDWESTAAWDIRVRKDIIAIESPIWKLLITAAKTVEPPNWMLLHTQKLRGGCCKWGVCWNT